MSDNKRILAGRHYFQGDQACAEGAIAAGCTLFAGYPITPATEISERLSWRLFEAGGIFVQGADELDSLTIVIGAAWGGAKSLTATSGNGICLMQENIGYACLTETPCVIVDVQRAGPSTGAATKTAQGDFYQVRYGSNSDYAIIALAPESPQEMFDLTVKAFNLAEQYRVPVFVMADEVIGHMREMVEVPEKVEVVERRKPEVPPDEFLPYGVLPGELVPRMPAFGEGYRMPVVGLGHNERGNPTADYEVYKKMVEHLVGKVEGNEERLRDIEEIDIEDAEVVVVAYGSVGRSAKRAVAQARGEGFKVGCARLRTLWPFPDPYFRDLAGRVKAFLVAEMSMGKLVREVERSSAGCADIHLISKPGIELHTPAEIYDAIRRVIV